MSLREEFYRRTLSNLDGRRIYPSVTIHYPKNVELGSRVVLSRGVMISAPARVSLGDNALVGPYTVINSGDHRFSDPTRPIRGQGHDLSPVVIEADSWIGAHVVILRGVTVGRGAVVGAGSVVTRSIPAMSVAVGVPARVIGSRAARDGAD